MLNVEPTEAVLGARVRGADLSKPLPKQELATIAAAIVQHGVVCICGQSIDPQGLRAFASQFGPMQVPEGIKEPGISEVSVLSNIVENGRNIGALDAGMLWHKDMTYQRTRGWVTVLYGIKIPRRDGHPLGATRFASGEAALRDLPADRKARLKDAIGIHDSVMYNTAARAAGSKRAAYSDDKIKRKEPLPHPLLFQHPISGRQILYCDPGHVARIDGLPDGEAREMLAFLGEHQLLERYQYAHQWTEGDVLMWDNLSTLHRATLDYDAHELRLMKRTQIVTPHDWLVPLARAKMAEVGTRFC